MRRANSRPAHTSSIRVYSEPMQNKPIRVLLVEDNLAHARAIGEGLCANLHDRFDLMCAERMSTGLDILARGRIDMLLLDLNLPDSVGLGTFERFHRAAPQIPIVIMTGVDDPTLGQHAVAAGARDVLVKGQIEPSLLARVIQHTVEKHRMEAASRNSSRSYGSVFDHALEAMLLTDDESRCLAVNSAASHLLGKSLSQIKGRPLPELLMVADDWKSRWSRWIHDGVMEGAVQYLRPDGSVGDMEFSVTPECIGACHLVVLRDVTARRRTEEGLRSSCDQWRALAGQHQASHSHLQQYQSEFEIRLAELASEMRQGALMAPGASAELVEGWAARLSDLSQPAGRSTRDRKAGRMGPVEALRSQASDFQKRTGIQCTVSSQLPDRSGTGGESPATVLCPILERALSNVAIQGDATAIQVRLWRESGRLIMEIEDNGRSLSEGQLTDPGTFRLSGVREQVLRFGGDFTLQGLPGKGTTLRVWLPHETRPRARKQP